MSASFAPECTEAKSIYDDCFSKWYTEEFLQGKSVNCEEVWNDYKACVDANLVRRGILPMLEQARVDAPFEKGGVPDGDKK